MIALRPRFEAALPGWRAVLRATVITALLAVCCIEAVPDGPFTHEVLLRRSHRGNVIDLARALRALGIDATEESVRTLLVEIGTPLIAARNAIVAPVQPLLDFLGLGQGWGLFLMSGQVAHRIRLEARTDTSDFQVVYRHHHQDDLGLAPWLTFRRVRGIYNPRRNGPRAHYEGFVSWITHKICADHPAIRGVRVEMERFSLRADFTMKAPVELVDVREHRCEAR